MFPFSTSCSDITSALTFGVFDFSIAPGFLYYAYLPIAIIGLLFGFFIFYKDKYSLKGKLFLFLTLTFALLLLNEIVTWTVAPASLVQFGWEIVAIFRVLVLLFTTYFVFVFIKQKDLPFSGKFLLGAFYTSVVLLIPTTGNIEYFNIDNCEGVPGWLWAYIHFLELLSIVTVLYITYTGTKKSQPYTNARQVNLIMGLSAALFLLIFFATSMWSDYTRIFGVAMAGPIGMLLFVSAITLLIVKYRTFNIELAAPIALIFTLWASVFSLLFVHTVETTRIIVGVTLFFLILVGTRLIQSIKREVVQREKIEHLADNLLKANDRLKVLDRMKSEFVSIASHQLRSPLTSIRGYASMLGQGTYGKLPDRVTEVVDHIAESAKYMALSVEDYLNVSRIEAGNMKYEMSDFNLKEIAEKIVDDLRPVAIKKGLAVVFRSNCSGSSMVRADIGKTRQVIMNLLDNSMKYTPKGSVDVVAHDDLKKKKMYITIIDTGIGMSKETQEEVFEKFVRAKNANSVNVTGSGLGLYVAKKMITDMGGHVSVESEGEGKGSQFHIELPLLSGNAVGR